MRFASVLGEELTFTDAIAFVAVCRVERFHRSAATMTTPAIRIRTGSFHRAPFVRSTKAVPGTCFFGGWEIGWIEGCGTGASSSTRIGELGCGGCKDGTCFVAVSALEKAGVDGGSNTGSGDSLDCEAGDGGVQSGGSVSGGAPDGEIGVAIAGSRAGQSGCGAAIVVGIEA